MSDAFLTVEDINSVLLKYGDVTTIHEIDTSKVDGEEYSDVMYDFCIISHSVNGDNHTFTFNVFNDLWCGGYYFKDSNGNYIDVNATCNDRLITFTTTEENVTLCLYLTNLFTTFNFERLSWISEDLINPHLFYNHKETLVFSIAKLDGSTATGTVLFTYGEDSSISTITDGTVEYALFEDNTYFNGIVKITYDGCSYYIKAKYIKDICPLNISEEVVASKLNTVGIDIFDGFEIKLNKGSLTYNNITTEIDFNESASFDLDLREKTNTRDIDVLLHINETSDVMGFDYKFKLPCDYLLVSDYSTLYNELMNIGGCRIFELSEDIALESDILINHDVKIIGNGHTINMQGHSFILNEGFNAKAENVSFIVGDPCWIQGLNSKLELTNCTFSGCRSTDYNNLGSVVLCDIDLESLNVEDDFTTIISNSSFVNNHSCILQGGQLLIDNCRYHNTDLTFVDKNNSAFLYQVDGEATITNSVFDIDYTDTALCEEGKSIGFAQALIKCGEDAIINDATHEYLSKNDSVLFCDAPYNNRSHIFAKYYYPQIESCVFSSPVLGKEDKAICYCVSGEDWVFKQNVQVTRADSDEENTNRKIIWDGE